MFKLGMGTNTENGIRIFGITIRIFVLGTCASVGSGDHFSVRAPDTSGYWYSTRSISSAVSSVWGFYKLFRIRLLIVVKLFLDLM